MSAVFDSPSLWQRARPVFTGYDVPLVLAVGLLALAGLVTMYSAGFDHGTRFVDHGRNMALAFVVLFLAAQIPPQQLLRDYQKNRVCTLLDPTTDPLGKGFHIIQGEIAIGSGGTTGKGFMKGTQTHLEFIPERTTDFIFAAFSEEFGLVGCVSLVLGFVFLIFRGLMIAAEAPSVFTRLLAGAITLSFFTYAFVNMGMPLTIP